MSYEESKDQGRGEAQAQGAAKRRASAKRTEPAMQYRNKATGAAKAARVLRLQNRRQMEAGHPGPNGDGLDHIGRKCRRCAR